MRTETVGCGDFVMDTTEIVRDAMACDTQGQEVRVAFGGVFVLRC